MTDWQLRDFVPSDLEELVRLDDASTTAHQPPVFALSDVVSAVSARNPAVVAVASGQIVGAAVGRVEGDQAWLLRLALDPAWRGRGLGSTLISELEHRLLAAGVRRIRALLPADETGTAAFANSGFTARPAMTLFEKSESVDPHAATLLRELGGSVPAAGLWQQVAGMVEEKRLVERRIVLPLAHPAEAHAHGVEPPRAVVLFGPPGTGKTTFARAVASRLAWPFVELFPSRMAAAEGGLAAGISVAFQRISELERVVVFIDEVEEIAAHRDGGLASVTVVNEVLKALVAFRKAGRSPPGLRHQLRPPARPGVPASRPLRLRPADRLTGRGRPIGDVGAPPQRLWRGSCCGHPRRCECESHARRHRARRSDRPTSTPWTPCARHSMRTWCASSPKTLPSSPACEAASCARAGPCLHQSGLLAPNSASKGRGLRDCHARLGWQINPRGYPTFGNGRKRMFGNGSGMGGWMFFGVLMLAGLVLLVVVVVRVIAGGVRQGTDEPTSSRGRPESQAKQLLDERYARGELSTDEYQERLRVLGQSD